MLCAVRLLASIELPPELINLFKALYTDTVSCMRVDEVESDMAVLLLQIFFLDLDWLLEYIVYRGMIGTSLYTASFSDVDFADDVALLSEMRSVLVLALEIMDEEAQPLGLTIN